MIGGFADCCARMLSGQPATAPPRSVMNSLRLICPTRCWIAPVQDYSSMPDERV